MKKLWIVLVALVAVVSCKVSPEDWEADFTGSWECIGYADMSFQEIEDLGNGELAKAIESQMTDSDFPAQMNFGNKKIEFIFPDYSVNGSYTIDENGGVLVDWNDEEGDFYWMYVQNDVLYMIEFELDDSGELSGEQTAYKFRLLSKTVNWQQ